MAMRSAMKRVIPSPFMERILRSPRLFSDGKGKVLSEEERAAENVYIKKLEKERLEKLKQMTEKEKAEKEKGTSENKS